MVEKELGPELTDTVEPAGIDVQLPGISMAGLKPVTIPLTENWQNWEAAGWECMTCAEQFMADDLTAALAHRDGHKEEDKS